MTDPQWDSNFSLKVTSLILYHPFAPSATLRFHRVACKLWLIFHPAEGRMLSLSASHVLWFTVEWWWWWSVNKRMNEWMCELFCRIVIEGWEIVFGWRRRLLKMTLRWLEAFQVQEHLLHRRLVSTDSTRYRMSKHLCA